MLPHSDLVVVAEAGLGLVGWVADGPWSIRPHRNIMNIFRWLAMAAVRFAASLLKSFVFLLAWIVIISIDVHPFSWYSVSRPARFVSLHLADVSWGLVVHAVICGARRIPSNLLRLGNLQLHLLYLIHVLYLPLAQVPLQLRVLALQFLWWCAYWTITNGLSIVHLKLVELLLLCHNWLHVLMWLLEIADLVALNYYGATFLYLYIINGAILLSNDHTYSSGFVL